MSFGYVELGAFGDGLQLRNKAPNAGQLFNTTIGQNETIESLVINYNPAKYTTISTTAPHAQLEVMSGTTSQAAVETGAGTVVGTQIGELSYTVTLPAGTKYFKILKAIVDSKNNTIYLNSVVVNTVKTA